MNSCCWVRTIYAVLFNEPFWSTNRWGFFVYSFPSCFNWPFYIRVLFYRWIYLKSQPFFPSDQSISGNCELSVWISLNYKISLQRTTKPTLMITTSSPLVANHYIFFYTSNCQQIESSFSLFIKFLYTKKKTKILFISSKLAEKLTTSESFLYPISIAFA